MDQILINNAADLIIESKSAIAFVGAGLSKESGIPTFRGDDGIWNDFPSTLYGNIPGLGLVFLFRFHRFRDFVTNIFDTFINARPNPGHLALGELSKRGILKAVITQNIDGLEREAGIHPVFELHGNIHRLRCNYCKKHTIIGREALEEALMSLSSVKTKYGMFRHIKRIGRCHNCDKLARPDVVFCGESLPLIELQQAILSARSSDIMLVLGTSGLVYPAASIPLEAKRNGAKIIEINPEPSALTRMTDIFIPEASGEALTAILEQIKNYY